jgi:hypothetical protein
MSSPNPPFDMLQLETATDYLAGATTVVQLLSVQYEPISRLHLPPAPTTTAATGRASGAHPQPPLPPPPPPPLLVLLLW